MNMDEIKQLQKSISDTIASLNLASLEEKRDVLKTQSEAADFWKDNKKASKTMQTISDLDEDVNEWHQLEKDINDLSEIADLGDSELADDIEKQFKKIKEKYDKKLNELSYSGPYDKSNAIISIYAGAGGTDSQDWVQMLLRMYLRWCERNKFKTNIVDESSGDEAGLKSVTFEAKGPKAYGKLKSEHGVHRLVRLSPFNAQNLRQTSFAKVEVIPEIDEPSDVPINESDLKIDVFRAGGHGGQSVNTTDSAVRITHLPTNTVVSIQNERSQLQNKDTAMTILRSKLAQMQIEQHKEKVEDLKGPKDSNEWGSQIRNYVLHPYNLVKDLRTSHETSNTQAVLDGAIDEFIDSYAKKNISR